MVRQVWQRTLAVLSVALMSACLGGQTGQPGELASGGHCDPVPLSPTSPWRNTTVEAAATTFVGSYKAGLQWQQEPSSAAEHTPVDFTDSVQINVAYDGAQAIRNCNDQLTVPVTVAVTTSQSGIHESGAGSIQLSSTAAGGAGSSGLTGTLTYDGSRIRLGATVLEASLGAAPWGGFDALDAALPGASAAFTEVP